MILENVRSANKRVFINENIFIMKNHLFIKLFFLFSVLSVALAQDSIYREEPIPDEVFTRRQQQAPKIKLVADHNSIQIGEIIKKHFKLYRSNLCHSH